jgi:hypothetical protein
VRLITAHRILIGTAIAFFLFYAGWRLRRWAVGGGAADLVQTAVSAAVAVVLVAYYRTLRGWERRR